MKKNISELTIQEIESETKKMKKADTFSRFLIGFLFGIMLYGLVTKGFGFIYTAIPIFLGYGIYKHSLTQKSYLVELESKKAARESNL